MILTDVYGIPVKWIGCADENKFATDDGLPKEVIVEHIAEGSLAGADSWFNNPASQASTNFMVGLNGEIHQYVRIFGEAPFANGVDRRNAAKVAKMDPRIKALWEKHGWANLNKLSLSVEHEGHSGDALTPKQFDASTKLTATLGKIIGKSGPDLTAGHYPFDPIDRPNCPGCTESTWRLYDAEVARLIGVTEGGNMALDWAPIKQLLDDVYNSNRRVGEAVEETRVALSELYAEIRRQSPGSV